LPRVAGLNSGAGCRRNMLDAGPNRPRTADRAESGGPRRKTPAVMVVLYVVVPSTRARAAEPASTPTMGNRPAIIAAHAHVKQRAVFESGGGAGAGLLLFAALAGPSTNGVAATPAPDVPVSRHSAGSDRPRTPHPSVPPPVAGLIQDRRAAGNTSQRGGAPERTTGCAPGVPTGGAGPGNAAESRGSACTCRGDGLRWIGMVGCPVPEAAAIRRGGGLPWLVGLC